jgi:hypothetical protein
VVAEGSVSADADDCLLCDNEEVPPVCLAIISLRTKFLPSAGTDVVLATSRGPRSLLARLALVEGVCEVVESCVRLS